MGSAFRSATLITIAHRLETLASYHRILVLSNGTLVAQGPPGEIIPQLPA